MLNTNIHSKVTLAASCCVHTFLLGEADSNVSVNDRIKLTWTLLLPLGQNLPHCLKLSPPGTFGPNTPFY